MYKITKVQQYKSSSTRGQGVQEVKEYKRSKSTRDERV